MWDARARARAIWTVLVFWVSVWTAAYMVSPGRSWHWFDTGARALLTGGAAGGLHIYHSHPELQIGPLSFVVAIPFTALSSAGARTVAAMVMSAAVLVNLGATMRLLPRRERGRVLLPGLLLVPVWEALAAGAGHLDDVLALTLGALAVAVLRTGRPVWAAVLLALAVDAKPRAVGFIAFLLLVRPGRRLAAF